MSVTDGGLRATLVEAALDLLEHGVGDVSLRAVARAAGVSAMAPYRHFPDKAALLGAVAERGFALLRERLMEADVAEPPREALVEQRGPAEATIDTACKASGYTVLSRRVAGIATHAPEAAALACWGLVHGLATLELDGREMADTPAHEAALRILVAGLDQ